MPETVKTAIGRRWTILTAVACVMALMVALYPWAAAFDILLYDESGYMNAGLHFSLERFRPYERTGLYPAFYGLLALLVPDPVELFPVAAITVLALGLGAYARAAWAAAAGAPFALTAPAVLILAHQLTVAPRVSFLGLAVIGVFLSVQFRAADGYTKLATALLGTWFLCYARAEYVLTFQMLLATAVILGIAALVRAPEWVRRIPELVRDPAHRTGHALLLTLVLVSLLHGFPLSGENKRSFMAFGQHFALRTVEDLGLAVDPWTQWESFVAEAFPGARSVGQAIAIAPDRVLAHAAGNAVDAIAWLGDRVLRRLVPAPESRGWPATLAAILFLAGSAALALRAALKGPAVFRSGRADAGAAMDVWVILALAAAPAASVLVVYPREHYLMLLLATVLLLPLRLLRGSQEAWPGRFGWAGAALAGLLIVAVPSLPAAERGTLAIIQQLRTLEPAPVHMLEVDGGWCIYVRPQCRTTYTFMLDPAEPAASVVERLGLDSIMVSQRFQGQSVIAASPTWQALIASPTEHGFAPIVLPDGHVLLRKIPGG